MLVKKLFFSVYRNLIAKCDHYGSLCSDFPSQFPPSVLSSPSWLDLPIWPIRNRFLYQWISLLPANTLLTQLHKGELIYSCRMWLCIAWRRLTVCVREWCKRDLHHANECLVNFPGGDGTGHSSLHVHGSPQTARPLLLGCSDLNTPWAIKTCHSIFVHTFDKRWPIFF